MRGGPKQPYEESLGLSGDLISSWLFPPDVFVQSAFPEGPPQPGRVYSADKNRMFSQNPGVGETALKRMIITQHGGWSGKGMQGYYWNTETPCLGRRGSRGGDA